MRRWGQLQEDKPDAWYDEMAKKIYRPDIYLRAAEELLDDVEFEPERFKEISFTEKDFPKTDGYKPATDEFIDGKTYDGKKPNDYIKSFKIGLKPE